MLVSIKFISNKIAISFFKFIQSIRGTIIIRNDSIISGFSLDTWMIAGVVTTTIIAPIVEELFFRGALQPRVGIWITSCVFALAHAQYGFFNRYDVFMLSLLLGWLKCRYSIWLSILVHILHNFAGIFSAGFLIRF